jgi:Zn-dependent protease with chaperone function
VVILFMLIPQFVVLFATLFLLPDSFGPGSWLVLAGAFATLAFLTWGGALRLWCLLRIARPAPTAVVEMVESLAAEMKFTGNIRVVQLAWPQVNAVAWVLEETVGFSRAMLEVMDLTELRAIAAHEVAHLLESRGVKAARVLHLFAYLPLAPLMKYGGSIGLLLGYVLMCGLFVGYKKFARRLESRADRLGNETLGDPGVYMRSMIKLHESNLAPAVMPGEQTHPHLYDRLLAAGIQPEFPRPMAPNRTRPTLAALGTTVAAVLVFCLFMIMAGCNQRLAHEMGAPPATTNSVDTH